MCNPDVQALALQLQTALGFTALSGQITLHVADSHVKSIEVLTVTKLPKGVDKA